MKARTRLAIRGTLEAVGVLLVLVLLGSLVMVLHGCTLVFVKGDSNQLEQVGGHNGWQYERPSLGEPSVRERLIGQHQATPPASSTMKERSDEGKH